MEKVEKLLFFGFPLCVSFISPITVTTMVRSRVDVAFEVDDLLPGADAHFVRR